MTAAVRLHRVLLRALPVCLLLLLLSLPAAADFTASGTFLYEDRRLGPDGFTGEHVWLPIRRADVEVVDFLTQTVIGTGQTDEDGAYAVFVQLGIPRTIYVRCLTDTGIDPSLHLSVLNDPEERAVYAAAAPMVMNHDPWADLAVGQYTVAAGEGGEAFNIFDVAVHALDYYHYLSGEYPGPAWSLTLFWRDNAGEQSCWYDDIYRYIFMADNAGYDDPVILHEAGHYVQSEFALCQSPGGSHFVTDMNQDRHLAFSEGFATYFSSAVRLYNQEPGADIFVRTTGGSGAGNLDFSFNVEGPSLPVFGSRNEVAVSASLLDLVDASRQESEGFMVDDDPLNQNDLLVWAVLTEKISIDGDATMESFWDGWSLLTEDSLSDSEAIFGSLGMEYAVDPLEPLDSAPSGASLLAVADPQPGPLVVINELSLGAVDWFELYNGGGEAVNLQGWTVRAGRNSTEIEVTLPAFTLHPHSHVAFFEGSGADGPDRRFLEGVNIAWLTSSDGFCSLMDEGGAGIDFCRWAGSDEEPPMGTAWSGDDPDLPHQGMNLGRDSTGSDDDLGGDFGPVAPTAAMPNWEPWGGSNHHTFYPADDPDWILVQAQRGQRYDLEVFNRLSGANAEMTLYAPDGVTALFTEACDGSFGSGPRRAWVAPADGEFLLRLVNSSDQGEKYGSFDVQATVIPADALNPSALWPHRLGLDAASPVTVYGDGFLPGLRASFSSVEITCSRVEVLDRTTAVLMVKTGAAAPVGFHDLLLSGPDGSKAGLDGVIEVAVDHSPVVINEVNILENWIELRNNGSAAEDLIDWEIRVVAGTLPGSAVLPAAVIEPGQFLVVYDQGTPGQNGPGELHLDQSFGWGLTGFGSCALVDETGAGRDFLRWDGLSGNSLDSPPAGTGWYGRNPVNSAGYVVLGRDTESSDSDSGTDFCNQEASPGDLNLAPAPLQVDLPEEIAALAEETLSHQLRAIGGEPPYDWYLSSGMLPTGMTLSSDGLLQGAPSEIGTWMVVLSVVDGAGRCDAADLILRIDNGVQATINAPYPSADFPCTVPLTVQLLNLRQGDLVLDGELTAIGAPPEGDTVYQIAHATLTLPAGQPKVFNLTCDVPNTGQFASGVIFMVTVRDASTLAVLDTAQILVENGE